ncbi:MAG TPA: STAS domain-containing protein [Solirubrobacteraceae bacterium]|jgi:rsbT antagonist protein RsbS|nr:STAS domain-containing protein [Solirubrobacteraceae bacterium]
MSIPILKHGRTLVVSLQSEPTDAEFMELQVELAQRVTVTHANGVIIDVTALEVLDSFATRTLREIAQTVSLCGARAAIVGVQPEVAFAMAQLGLSLEGTLTALDLEDGLALLHAAPAVAVR